MSQYPQYPPPPGPYGTLPYAGPGAPLPASRRPTSVTVLAVIGIILGSLGLVGGVFGLVMTVAHLSPPNPVTDMMRDDPFLAVWSPISTILALALMALLLAGSIGALSLKAWARKSMLAYAIGIILLGLIGFGVNLMYLLPALDRIPQNTAQARLTVQVGRISAIGGGVIGMIFPCCILFFMTGSHVKAAFDEPGSGGPGTVVR